MLRKPSLSLKKVAKPKRLMKAIKGPKLRNVGRYLVATTNTMCPSKFSDLPTALVANESFLCLLSLYASKKMKIMSVVNMNSSKSWHLRNLHNYSNMISDESEPSWLEP